MKMSVRLNFIFSCTAFFILLGFTNGDVQKRFSRKLAGNIYRTIYVDPTNQNSYPKIQAAIDSVPSNNQNWICISIKAGVFIEQVVIPSDKPFIYLKGEGIGRTSVVWGGSESLFSSTFTSLADNIMVSGIAFVNSYNYPPGKNINAVKPAVAARISGDKSMFYMCSFLGYQDTLWDDAGRHFFKLCTIEGAIDFIFGGAQSIYEDCTISVNVGIGNPGFTGFIAAQARENPNDTGGFVFRHCTVSGQGHVLLGRAWRSKSRVIYYNSILSDIVDPRGWDAWSFTGQEDQITFAESGCQGPGSNMTNRVKWEKNLTPDELQSFISNSFIDTEGWIDNLPAPL